MKHPVLSYYVSSSNWFSSCSYIFNREIEQRLSAIEDMVEQRSPALLQLRDMFMKLPDLEKTLAVIFHQKVRNNFYLNFSSFDMSLKLKKYFYRIKHHQEILLVTCRNRCFCRNLFYQKENYWHLKQVLINWKFSC